MTSTELKDWLSILGMLVALPAAAFGMYFFVRHWRARARKEAGEGLAQDKELAYLAAMHSYMSELNRPLGYSESEFTPGEGRVVDEEQIDLRYVFRRAKPADMLGRTPSEIAGGDAARPVRDVTAMLRDSRRPIVLLGDPGSGKSVTLRHLAQSLAAQPVFVNDMPVLPVYLHLGRYRQASNRGLPERFAEFVRDELKHVVPRGDVVLAVLADALAQGRIFLLLDALDEMPTRHYTERVEEINRFLVEHGGRNRVVIACRRREYTGALPHTELIVEPFRPSHIRAYLDKHWELYNTRLGPAAADPAVRKAYMALAKPEHPMHAFATNPFSLKLMAHYFFFTGGRVPSAQADLFENYIRRRLAVEGTRQKLTEIRQGEVLGMWQALAFDALRSNLGTYLRQPGGAKAVVQGFTVQALAEAIKIGVQCGLIREEADGAVRFEHHRLLEYLAARHWDVQDRLLTINTEHLSNPWWRETLVLRAGVTAQPEALIRSVLHAIDRRYLAVLGLGLAEEPPPADVEDSDNLRLNGIVALELALACARERVTDVSDELFTWLAPLVTAIPKHGTLIEKVRLARSLRGLPLLHSHQALAALAATDSEWLANEVFAAIDEGDYDTPEFSAVLAGLVGSKTHRSMLARLFAIKGLSWRKVVLMTPQRARLALLREVASDLFSRLALPVVILVAFYSMRREFAFTAEELTRTPAQLTLAGVLIATLIFGVLVAGWRLTLVTALFSSISFAVLPVLSAQRLTFALFFYQVCAAPSYRRGTWLRNPFTRYFRVFLTFPTWERLVALFLVYQALVIFALFKLTGVGVPLILRTVLALIATVLTESAVRWIEHRRIRALIQRGASATGEAALRAHLDACAEALRLPMLPPDGARLLEHMVGLKLDEGELIQALLAVSAGQQFFLSSEAVLQAIDRLDLRRRQKALGGA